MKLFIIHKAILSMIYAYCLRRIQAIFHQSPDWAKVDSYATVQGRTQTWLAEKIEKSYVVVTNYCNNNAQPSIEVLRKIAKVLNIDVRELLVPTKDDEK